MNNVARMLGQRGLVRCSPLGKVGTPDHLAGFAVDEPDGDRHDRVSSPALGDGTVLDDRPDDNTVRAGHWDRYTALYNPARVMNLFDRHLIQPALRNPDRRHPQLAIGWRDTLAYWQLKLEMRLGGN